MAQNNEKKEFERKYSALTQEVANARKQKDYKKAEKLNWEKLKLYQGLPQQLQENAKNITGLVYYDLACYQALQGKKKAALKNFEKAFNSGWNDYNHAKGDSDIDNLRKEKKYLEIMAKMRLDSDYLYILQQAEGYNRTETKPICYNESVTDTLPRFTYMNPNDSNLVQLRKHFNLDSIAGSGDEISKIKNLLYWVHNIVPHDGNSRNPEERNTIAMVELCKKENRGVNCRMMAQMLNECYLAMGFKSRFITCMPKVMINDCHVINAVYSNTLDKWLWMDPTFNAYVTDEKGKNVISLLSGHMGGANEMALYISHLIESNPVITTATDVNNKSSLDMIAKRLDGYIENFRDNVLKVNSMIVNNKPVGLFIDGDYDIDTRGFTILKYEDMLNLDKRNNEEINDLETVVVISNKQKLDFESKKIIKLVPKDIVLGVGCKKNIDSKHMKDSLREFLHINNIDKNAIKAIGSIEIKKDEQAIIDLANSLGVPFKIFTVEEIAQVDYLYSKSEWVKKNVGVYSVAEPCAHLLSEGNMIIEKQKFKGITFSAGRVNK